MGRGRLGSVGNGRENDGMGMLKDGRTKGMPMFGNDGRLGSVGRGKLNEGRGIANVGSVKGIPMFGKLGKLGSVGSGRLNVGIGIENVGSVHAEAIGHTGEQVQDAEGTPSIPDGPMMIEAMGARGGAWGPRTPK